MSKKDGEDCYNNIDCESNLCVANICTQQSASDHIEKERNFANALKTIEEKKEELDDQEFKLFQLQKQMEELDKKKELEKKSEKKKILKIGKRKEMTKLDLDRQRRGLVRRDTETKEIISNLEKRKNHEDEENRIDV